MFMVKLSGSSGSFYVLTGQLDRININAIPPVGGCNEQIWKKASKNKF